jgi:hypothetical protein
MMFRIVETGQWIDKAYTAAVAGVSDGSAPVDVVWAGGNHIEISLPEGFYDVYFDETNLKVWIEACAQ